MEKPKRKLENKVLAENIKVTEVEVNLDDLVEEYAAQLSPIFQYIKTLNKNQLKRVLFNTIAPPFLINLKKMNQSYEPQSKVEAEILFDIYKLEDVKTALLYEINRQMELSMGEE